MTSSTSLGAALEAFILEHEYRGELDTAVEDHRVWMTGTCGAAVTVQNGNTVLPQRHIDADKPLRHGTPFARWRTVSQHPG